MLRTLSLVVLLALAPLGASTASAAELIGYVDMQRVLEESVLGKRLQEELRTQFEPQAQGLAQEEQEILQLRQTLERDAPLMSETQVKSREAEIEQRIQDFQKEAASAQQALFQVQQEKGREIIPAARDAVDRVARERKVKFVVERGLTGILFMDDALDLTPLVIKQLDASKSP